MAETPDGNYYYDAGTVNEQLDEFAVFEEDGKLHLADESGGDVHTLAYHLFLSGFRSESDGQVPASVVDDDATVLYARDTGTDIILEVAHNDPADGIAYATVATFTGAGDDN